MRHYVVKWQVLNTFNWFFMCSSKGSSPLILTAEWFGCVYSKLVKIRSKTFVCRLTRNFQLDSGGINASLIWSISPVESNLSSLLNIEKQQLLSDCEVSITFALQRDAAVTWCWWIYEYVIWQEGGFKNSCCTMCLVIILNYFPWLGHLYFSPFSDSSGDYHYWYKDCFLIDVPEINMKIEVILDIKKAYTNIWTP